MNNPTAFPNFALLPTELRLRIYNLSLSHPRVIHLRTPDYPSNISYLPSPYLSISALNLTYSDISWTTRTPPPSLLSVSVESRVVALAYYTLRFALLPAGPEVIYINPKLDIIFAHVEKWPEMLKVLLGDLRAFDVVDKGMGVRRLVLSTRVWRTWFDPDMNDVGERQAEMLAGLEEVTVVMRKTISEDEDADTNEGEADGGVLVAPEPEEEVALWAEEILRGWMVVKDAGLADGVDLRLLTWRQGLLE